MKQWEDSLDTPADAIHDEEESARGDGNLVLVNDNTMHANDDVPIVVEDEIAQEIIE